MSTVALDGQGRFIVARTFTPGVVALYDAKGRFIRTFGRSGQGPGEFRSVQRLTVGPGDTVHVFEGIRHTALTPGLQSLAFLRQLPFAPHSVAFRADGRLVAQHLEAGTGSSSGPFHLLDSRGRVVRSFGDADRSLQIGQIYQAARWIAPARNGGLWSTRLNEYRIDLWDRAGRHQATFSRNAEWFQPWEGMNHGEPFESRPRPVVANLLREDRQGRLWVGLTVADRNWRPRNTSREVPVHAVDDDELYDSIVELIDPAQGRVLARVRFDKVVGGFLGDDMLYMIEDEDDVIVATVWQARLTIP